MGVHIAASWQNIGFTDRITTWGRHQELSIQQLHDSTKLVVSNHLLQAEFKVLHNRLETFLFDLSKSCINDGFGVWLLLAEEAAKIIEDSLNFLHATSGVSGLVDKGSDSGTRSFNN